MRKKLKIHRGGAEDKEKEKREHFSRKGRKVE